MPQMLIALKSAMYMLITDIQEKSTIFNIMLVIILLMDQFLNVWHLS
jgi:hypothetical protein